MNKIKAIFLDLGDVIMDEETEVKDASGVTLRAELIDGARETLYTLKERGYSLALVADTEIGTYKNVLNQHGLYHLFDAFAISREVGCLKPCPAMFKKALDDLGIREEDYPRVVMVGNNLERDIIGANRLGLTSVWSHWNDRYKNEPEGEEEVPDYIIGTLPELLEILDEIESELVGGEHRLRDLPLEDCTTRAGNDGLHRERRGLYD